MESAKLENGIRRFYNMQMQESTLSFVYYTKENPFTPQVALSCEDIPNNTVKIDVNLNVSSFSDTVGELNVKYSLILSGNDIEASDSDYCYASLVELKNAFNKIYDLYTGKEFFLNKRLSMYVDVRGDFDYLLVDYGGSIISQDNIPDNFKDGIYTFRIPVIVPSPDGLKLKRIYFPILIGEILEHDKKLSDEFPNRKVYATYAPDGKINGRFLDDCAIYIMNGDIMIRPLSNRIAMFCNERECMSKIFEYFADYNYITNNILKAAFKGSSNLRGPNKN